MFEEVDKLINNIKEKQELDDYINKNIYPERLKFTSEKKYISPIKETIFPEFVLDDISKYYLDVKKKLDDVNEIIISSKNQQLFDDIETCPICINKLNETNVIIPNCGHKTCIKCFVDNLHLNKHSGNLCSICRTSIV